MKRTIGILILAAAISAVLSCEKNDVLRYDNVTMCNIDGGRLISDQGNVFNVVERMCAESVGDSERVIVNCDVLSQTPGGADNEYDIRLNQMLPVLVKETVLSSETTEEMTADDPANIAEIWYSGGYINMQIRFAVKENSETRHLINLVLDEEQSIDGKYVFALRHNAYWELPDQDSAPYRIAGSYVSFPVADLFEGDEAKVKITWKWYKSAGSGITAEVEQHELEFDWKRTAFEQGPRTLTTKTGSVR